MQIFIVNITRVVWPHVTNLLDLRYFCQHNPLFYHLNLIPCHYWSWQRNIYFLVNIFVRHTFPMSKSSIKTKTVLTMTDMTKSTELLAFKRQKDGYKVTVKISLCNCVVVSWDELKVRCPSGLDPPSADLDPHKKLSENIILNVLVKIDDTLRSSAY